MEGVDIVIVLVILPNIQRVLREQLGLAMQCDRALVDLEEDGELV